MEPTTAPQNLSDALIRAGRWNRLRNRVHRLTRRLRPSEPHVRTVWLIVTAPVDGTSPIGVMHTTRWRVADSLYAGAVADSIEMMQRHNYGLNVWLLTTQTAARGDSLGAEILILLGQDRAEWPVAREWLP